MGPKQTADRQIALIAARQFGLVTRRQLLAAGLAADAVRWRVRSGSLAPVHRGVYRVGPLSVPRSREMAAVLACGTGAVISHRSAAVLVRLPLGPGRAAAVDVTVAGFDRGRRPGIRVHRVEALAADEVTEVDGIPITTIARTIIDLAGDLSSAELARVLAYALAEDAVKPAALLELLARRPRRPGAGLIRALLQDEAAPALTRSEAEDRLLRLVTKAQLPRPTVNARIDRWEVDFVWRAQRLVVEVDGFAFHSSRTRFENDRRRDAALTALGFRVMRVTWRQLSAEPEVVLVRLTQALGRQPRWSNADA